MKQADRVAGGLFLAISAGIAFDVRRLEVLPVGPGTIPLLVAVLLAAIALVIVAKTFRRGGERFEVDSLPAPTSPAHPIYVVLAVALYVFALSRIGYLVATFALVVAMLVRLADMKPSRIVAVALAVSLGTFLVFQKLGIRLPAWLLETYLS
jgi:putative tricarboxylic transport membrane protein